MRGMQRAANQDFDGAIDDYSQAIKLNPADPGLYIVRAGVFDMKGDYARAIEDYEKAISLQPGLERGLQRQLESVREKAGARQ